MWLLDRCRADWQASGTPFDYAELSRLAEEPAANLGFVDPDDRRFFNPASMATEIAESLRETGQSVPGDPVSLSRVILDSLAQKYALVIGQIGRLLGRPVRGIRIVGGGSQNHYLNQTTADATGLPVVAGPVEATAIGNLVVQAMKAGRFSTLGEARQFVARASPTTSYQPGQPGMRATRAARFRAHLERSGAEL
jgi:rhamnulokinase